MVTCVPVIRLMYGENDSRIETILFDGGQNRELILAFKLLDHLC